MLMCIVDTSHRPFQVEVHSKIANLRNSTFLPKETRPIAPAESPDGPDYSWLAFVRFESVRV